MHIFKYLNIQACRMDKKPDSLDLPSLGGKRGCLPQPLTDRYTPPSLPAANHINRILHMYRPPSRLVFQCSMEDFYPSKNHGPDSGIGSDNGDKRLSTTEVRGHFLSPDSSELIARL